MRVTRRSVLRTLAGTALAGGAGLGVYGVAIERHRLEVTRTDLPIDGLPPGLSGLRIGLISDIHHGAWTPREDVEAAGALLREARPDLVLLAGDYVTWGDRASLGPCADALAPLEAPLGVFAVPGNHDPDTALASTFQTYGIRVLRDEQAQVRARGERITLGGLRYWTRTPTEVERVFRGARGVRILLAHDPRRLTLARSLGIPLVLAGHTHGGQVVLPAFGAPAAARFPFAWGLARHGGTTLYVTRGIGTSILPVRFNCPPEVAILTLRPAARAVQPG